MSTRSYVPSPAIGVVMVRLRPGALQRIVRAAADEIADTNVAAADVWGTALSGLEEQVAAANDAKARGALVQRFLMERLSVPSRGTSWDSVAVRIAETIAAAGGQVSIRSMADDAGLSERQLERRFAAAIGMQPKRFARLARFARALSVARTGIGWAEVAAMAGFSDQSHLTREFIALVGLSPEALARCGRVSTSKSARSTCRNHPILESDSAALSGAEGGTRARMTSLERFRPVERHPCTP